MLKNVDTDNRDIWVGQTEASRITGVPVRSIINWLNSGIIRTNEYREVSLIEVFKQEGDRLNAKLEKLREGSGPQQRLIKAQCRKCEAEASLREWELSQESEKFIATETVKGYWEISNTVSREILSDLPSTVATAIAKTTNPREIQEILTIEIDRRLWQISHKLIEADGDRH